MVTNTNQDNIKLLVENNVALQNKMVDLVKGVKDLVDRMDQMLLVFNEASNFVRLGKSKDPLVTKLNDLLEQNKNLAKGLLLLEEYVKTKTAPNVSSRPIYKTKF